MFESENKTFVYCSVTMKYVTKNTVQMSCSKKSQQRKKAGKFVGESGGQSPRMTENDPISNIPSGLLIQTTHSPRHQRPRPHSRALCAGPRRRREQMDVSGLDGSIGRLLGQSPPTTELCRKFVSTLKIATDQFGIDH